MCDLRVNGEKAHKKKKDSIKKIEPEWKKKERRDMYWDRIFKFNGHIKRKKPWFASNGIDATAVLSLCSHLQPFILQTGHSESKFAGDDCPYIKANAAACNVALQTDKLSS